MCDKTHSFFLKDNKYVITDQEHAELFSVSWRLWTFKESSTTERKWRGKGIGEKFPSASVSVEYTFGGRTEAPILWNWCRQLLESSGARQRELWLCPYRHYVVVRLKWQVGLHVWKVPAVWSEFDKFALWATFNYI